MDPTAAVLIATSDVEEALEAADRILIMLERGIAGEHCPGQEDLLEGLSSLETLVAGASSALVKLFNQRHAQPGSCGAFRRVPWALPPSPDGARSSLS